MFRNYLTPFSAFSVGGRVTFPVCSPVPAWFMHDLCSCVCTTRPASSPTCLLNDECRPPGSPPHFSFQLFACGGSSFLQLFLSSVQLTVTWFLKFLSSDRSDLITGWPTVPCLCSRASTISTRPSLEGERVEQQTTALHQSLWRQRWAGGRFMPALKPAAHLEYFFNVSQCFHRSRDSRQTFS